MLLNYSPQQKQYPQHQLVLHLEGATPWEVPHILFNTKEDAAMSVGTRLTGCVKTGNIPLKFLISVR